MLASESFVFPDWRVLAAADQKSLLFLRGGSRYG